MKLALEYVRRGAVVSALWLVVHGPAMAQLAPDWTTSAPGAMVAPADAADGLLVAGTVSGASPNFRISKLDAAGATLWTKSPLVGAVTLSANIIKDRAGNVIVTGTAATGPFVAKLDAAGNLVWRSDQSPSLGWPAVSAVDASGSVYIVQQSYVPDPTVNNERYVLTKYTPSGALEWSRDCGPAVPYSLPSSLTITGAGLPVVMNFPALWGRAGNTTLTVFDPAGNHLLTKEVPIDYGIGAMVGPNGEYVLVGGSAGRSLVVKHDANLTELWRQSYDVGNLAMAGAVDTAGSIYFPAATATPTAMSAYATVKLLSSGNFAWARPVGPAVDGLVPTAGQPIVFGPDGSAYLPGNVPRLVVDAYGNATKRDQMVVLKYSTDGAELWRSALVDGRTGSNLALTPGGGVVAQASHSSDPPLLLRYSQSGVPNQPPTVLASANPSAGVAPLAVQFSSNGSTDADGTIKSYLWTFGDGQTSTLANPSHTYAQGSYVATLRLTDNLGASATSSVAISVAPPPPRPTAITLASPTVLQRSSTTATVALSNTSGATVSLSSSDPSAASVPSSVVVPRGASSGAFTVTTLKVTKSKTVTITATANGGTASTVLTVVPR